MTKTKTRTHKTPPAERVLVYGRVYHRFPADSARKSGSNMLVTGCGVELERTVAHVMTAPHVRSFPHTYRPCGRCFRTPKPAPRPIAKPVAAPPAEVKPKRHFYAVKLRVGADPLDEHPALISTFQPLDTPEIKAFWGMGPQHTYIHPGRFEVVKEYPVPPSQAEGEDIWDAYDAIRDQFQRENPPKPIAPERADGWVAPDGLFYECGGAQGHVPLARLVCFVLYNVRPNQADYWLCERGWVKVYYSGQIGIVTTAGYNDDPLYKQVTEAQLATMAALRAADKDPDWRECIDNFVELVAWRKEQPEATLA